MEENNEIKKTALYCRVSTGNQTNDNQKIRLLQYAAERNLKFDLYEEVESTRKTRPIKQQLLEKLRNGIYKSVVVYKLDRWARSSTELVLEITELIKREVEFISISDNLDFSTASGKLHFQILSAFAEFERALISERTKDGLYRTKLNGTKLGRPTGSRDKRQRKRSGYILRQALLRQKADQDIGKFQSISAYIDIKQRDVSPNAEIQGSQE